MDISVLLGKTLKEIKGDEGSNQLIFICTDGIRYQMYHEQRCCESVTIDDINGDLDDLIGSPITHAEEVTNHDDPPAREYAYESYTWTFYHIATIKGWVTIKWFGESNGYYSESADFIELKK